MDEREKQIRITERVRAIGILKGAFGNGMYLHKLYSELAGDLLVTHEDIQPPPEQKEEVEVYSQPHCMYSYCPYPEECKQHKGGCAHSATIDNALTVERCQNKISFASGSLTPGYTIQCCRPAGHGGGCEFVQGVPENKRLAINPKTNESKMINKDGPMPEGWRWF